MVYHGPKFKATYHAPTTLPSDLKPSFLFQDSKNPLAISVEVTIQGDRAYVSVDEGGVLRDIKLYEGVESIRGLERITNIADVRRSAQRFGETEQLAYTRRHHFESELWRITRVSGVEVARSRKNLHKHVARGVKRRVKSVARRAYASLADRL